MSETKDETRPGTSHGFLYKVKETEVYVRNRPKSLTMGATDFEAEDRADAYLSVTDTWVVPPKDRPFVWMPWNEGRKPSSELYYATNRVLNWWIYYVKLSKIQVFCDGGTHRSVTIFGAYLLTHFTREEAQEIVRTRVSINNSSHAHAHPLEYIDRYLSDIPEDWLLFQSMGKHPMDRLDRHCSTIDERIRDRFGDELFQRKVKNDEAAEAAAKD